MPKGSPYSRKGKTPHRYSPLLMKLIAARAAGDHDEAERLADAHSRAYHMRKRFSLTSIRIDEDDDTG